jgi:hypothetical protein
MIGGKGAIIKEERGALSKEGRGVLIREGKAVHSTWGKDELIKEDKVSLRREGKIGKWIVKLEDTVKEKVELTRAEKDNKTETRDITMIAAEDEINCINTQSIKCKMIDIKY